MTGFAVFIQSGPTITQPLQFEGPQTAPGPSDPAGYIRFLVFNVRETKRPFNPNPMSSFTYPKKN